MLLLSIAANTTVLLVILPFQFYVIIIVMDIPIELAEAILLIYLHIENNILILSIL